MKAKKKEIQQIELSDLGLDPASALTEIVNLEAVPERGQARMMDGTTRESVEQLVRILKEEEKIL
jgi:electron transfer flavoprotein alpha/beta subunit